MRRIGMAIGAGFGGFLALLAAVILSGATFSQRCAAVYERGSASHELCVARASAGGPVHEENIGRLP